MSIFFVKATLKRKAGQLHFPRRYLSACVPPCPRSHHYRHHRSPFPPFRHFPPSLLIAPPSLLHATSLPPSLPPAEKKMEERHVGRMEKTGPATRQRLITSRRTARTVTAADTQMIRCSGRRPGQHAASRLRSGVRRMSSSPPLAALDRFAPRHLGPRLSDHPEMLATIGIDSVSALVQKTVPSNILLDRALDLGKVSVNITSAFSLSSISNPSRAPKVFGLSLEVSIRTLPEAVWSSLLVLCLDQVCPLRPFIQHALVERLAPLPASLWICILIVHIHLLDLRPQNSTPTPSQLPPQTFSTPTLFHPSRRRSTHRASPNPTRLPSWSASRARTSSTAPSSAWDTMTPRRPP